MLAWLRGLAVGLETRGGDWRAVVDGLRPHTQSIWRVDLAGDDAPPARALPRTRSTLVGHSSPSHGVRDCRGIGAMIAHGRLEIVAGKVVDAIPEGDGAA